MNGYWGKLLVADLSKGMLIDEPLNEQYARDFIGSTGLAARYLFDLIDKETDPLGPDNVLILGMVVFAVCLLSSGLGVRAAFRVDPATALRG